MPLTFSKGLIKGKIAEIVFDQMFRESGEFTIIPFGYEYTMPELAQFDGIPVAEKVINNIRNAPDFVLIEEDKKQVYLVEVKYRSHMDKEELRHIAQKVIDRWKIVWLFVATPQGFFFQPCSEVLKEGNIEPLAESWVSKDIQDDYLRLLVSFEH